MFDSREHAGVLLARELKQRWIQADLVVGLARGGVIVAHEVAVTQAVPLIVLVVKKLSAPDNCELAVGALAPDGVTYIDQQIVTSEGIDQQYLQHEIIWKQRELVSSQSAYQKYQKRRSVLHKKVILVDDGIATGATARVAITYLKNSGAASIILAAPVVERRTLESLCIEVDECAILETPENFQAVGEFYRNFEEVTEKTVITLLKKSR